MSANTQSRTHQSFLVYAGGRYGFAALALVALSAALYLWHEPLQTPNGGTWLGYTLGTIAGLLIVWLILFGVRKRSYRSSLGSVKGWLSAHVYLGASLLIVATLHSGLQLGWNIHTAAYVLMLIVIFSGFVGVYFYIRYPRLAAGGRDHRSRDELLLDVIKLDNQALRVAEAVDPATKALVASAVERTEIGGGWWDQIAGRDRSKLALTSTSGANADSSNRLSANADQRPLLSALAERLANSRRGGEETSHLQELLNLTSKKRELLQKVRKDIKMQALVQLWLYLHVPLSFALLGALLAHIFSVFTYW